MSGSAPTVAVRSTSPLDDRNTTVPGSVFLNPTTATATRLRLETSTLVTLLPYADSGTRLTRLGALGRETSTMSSETSVALVTKRRLPRSAAVSPEVVSPTTARPVV